MSALLLLLLLVSVPMLFVFFLLWTPALRLSLVLPASIILAGLCSAYYLSRGRYALWAPSVFSITYAIGISAMLRQAQEYALIPLFLAPLTLFTSIFASRFVSFSLTGFNLLLMSGIYLREPLSREPLLQSNGTLIYLLTIPISLLISYYRNALDQANLAEMRASQEQMRTFFNTANDWIFTLDPDGRFLFINDTMSAETGYAPGEVVGHRPEEFLVNESAEVIAEAIKRILAGEKIEVFTAEVCLRNGRHFWVEVRGRALQNAQGHIVQTVHIARDITQRMAQHGAEQEQRKFAEALSDIATLLNSSLELELILDQVLDNIHRVLPYDVADVTLIQDGKTRVVRHRGYDTLAATDSIEQATFEVEKTPNLRRMAETGQPISIADVRYFPGWIWAGGLEWLRSLAGAPIMRQGICLGFLHVASTRPGVYTAVHAERLQAFANQVAHALHNARLYELEQKRRHLAEMLRQITAILNSSLSLNEVLNRILEQLGRAIPFDSAAVQQLEGESSVLRAVTGFSHPEKLLGLALPITENLPNGYVIRQRCPITFPNVAQVFPHFYDEAEKYQSGQIRSWLGVPMLFDEEVIGLITLDRHEVRPFTAEEIETAATFAQHAAIALHNASLYDQLARYNETLETAVARRTAELLQTTEQVSAILENSPDAILLFDHELKLQLVNPAYWDMFGYSKDTQCLDLPGCLVTPEESPRFLKAVEIARQEKHALRLNFVAQRQDGSHFDADIALTPIHQVSGALQLLCSIRDISALKEIERVKDDFVSNVSHELRTPIANLQLHYDLLQLNPAKGETYIQRIGREIGRLSTIVEGLLQLSRLDQERIEWEIRLLDLNELVESYLMDRLPLANSRSIHLEHALAPDLPGVQGDARLLGQTLSILLTNALNYTPGGGTVSVRTTAKIDHSQHWVGFQISDTGLGILPEEMPNILKRFYRGQAGRKSGEPGTGLGLAIADEIVRHHRGKIEIYSAGEGQGATFTVWLPAATPVITNGNE